MERNILKKGISTILDAVRDFQVDMKDLLVAKSLFEEFKNSRKSLTELEDADSFNNLLNSGEKLLGDPIFILFVYLLLISGQLDEHLKAFPEFLAILFLNAYVPKGGDKDEF